jgi:hypothetical protein
MLSISQRRNSSLNTANHLTLALTIPTHISPVQRLVARHCEMKLACCVQLLSRSFFSRAFISSRELIISQERSSAKRKELFNTIQNRSKADPAAIAKQMVLDMKVRWSSTFAMLHRGYELRKARVSVINLDKCSTWCRQLIHSFSKSRVTRLAKSARSLLIYS